MDWDGTPVRDGSVSPTVPDRRPVGVFLERDSDELSGPSLSFHPENPLLSANFTRRDSFHNCLIIFFPLTLFSRMNRLDFIQIKLVEQLSEGEDGRI